MGKLDGKIAVITGGASGIGAASVRLFVGQGAKVVIVGIRDDKGEHPVLPFFGNSLIGEKRRFVTWKPCYTLVWSLMASYRSFPPVIPLLELGR